MSRIIARLIASVLVYVVGSRITEKVVPFDPYAEVDYTELASVMLRRAGLRFLISYFLGRLVRVAPVIGDRQLAVAGIEAA